MEKIELAVPIFGVGESCFQQPDFSQAHAFLNSQYANEAMQQRRQGEQTVVVHPNDAAARKIKTGDYIRVFNDRGSFEGKAELSDDVQEGLAVANLGYWPGLTRSGSAVNATTSSSHCNLGGAGCQSDNRVEIARVWSCDAYARAAVLVIDDTAVPKKGKHSVGVASQYASALGKNADCQTLVSLTLARDEVPVMVALRLFLPESWTNDRVRLKRAGVPVEYRTARTKPEIALAEIVGQHVFGRHR